MNHFNICTNTSAQSEGQCCAVTEVLFLDLSPYTFNVICILCTASLFKEGITLIFGILILILYS